MTTITGTPGVATGYVQETAIITQTLNSTSGAIAAFVQFLSVKQGWIIQSVKVNTGATVASCTISVGDTGNAARYIAAATALATPIYVSENVPTAVTSGLVTAGAGYQYAADDTIGITVAGAALVGQVTLTVTFIRSQAVVGVGDVADV